MKIEVPGVGVVEFPDGTAPEVIEQSLAQYRNGPSAQAPRAEPQSRGLLQLLRENIVGDSDPTTQNFGEKVGSFLNKGGESMTMGLIGDEASAAVESLMPGVNYETRRDHYRGQEELFEQTNPGMALTADIGGAVAAPLGALGAVGKGAGMFKRMAASGIASGAMGGTYGLMEGGGDLDNRVADAKSAAYLSGGLGLAAPGAGGVLQRIMKSRAGRKAVNSAAENAPTSEQLRQMGNQAYQAVDDAGVSINPAAFGRMSDDIVGELRGRGLDELPGAGSLTPKTARVTQIMRGMGDEMAGSNSASLPFSSLDQLRRHAGTAAGDITNKTDSALGSQVVSGLDDFVGKLGPQDVDAGDISVLQSALPKARETWARMSRSQAIDDIIDGSQDYLSGGASGIRNGFRKLLKNPKALRGFSEPEIAMMRRVINGSIPEQAVLMAGSGLGRLAAVSGGGVVGGLPGFMGGLAAGAGARKLSDKIVTKNAETVRSVIANGGLPQLPTNVGALQRSLIEKLMRQGSATVPQ